MCSRAESSLPEPVCSAEHKLQYSSCSSHLLVPESGSIGKAVQKQNLLAASFDVIRQADVALMEDFHAEACSQESKQESRRKDFNLHLSSPSVPVLPRPLREGGGRWHQRSAFVA